MSAGMEGFISQEQMRQIREETGLNPTHMAREVRRFGVSIAGQTIARWEDGGAASDPAKLAGYLDALLKIRKEHAEAEAAKSASGPQHEAVKALISQVSAAREGLDFFMSTRAQELSADDMRLLALSLENAGRRFKWATAALNGAAHRSSGAAAR